MSNSVIVHKNRTNTIQIDLGRDISSEGETAFSSEIRTEPSTESTLIAAWEVHFKTDGTDGLLILRLDDSVTTGIEANSGYMDLLWVVEDEPLPVFDAPLEVIFRGSVTLYD